MSENWKIKSHNPVAVCKTFIDKNGREVLFEVALTDISANSNIDLDEPAEIALKKVSQKNIKKYRFTGSHFEPE
ncbi:MAG: hypothetical protein AAB861_01120 [Patescibacteria group bacterium]